MNSIKVETPATDRTPEEAARAAPVSLPAGSYDAEALSKDLDEAAKAKNDGKREDLVAAALEKHNEIGTEPATDLQPGYKRVAVENVDLGIVEDRVVYDPGKADEAAAFQAELVNPAPAPAAATKGE